MLCMVIMFSTSVYLHAESPEEETAVVGEVTQKLPEELSTKSNANEWQIVSGKYESGAAQVSPTLDGVFRIQKHVVPTETENEFYVYLNIEPQMEWRTEIFLRRATIWIANSASVKEGTGTGLSENSTANDVKGEVKGSGQVAKLSDSWEEANAPDNTTSMNQPHNVETIVVSGTDIRLTGNWYYSLSQKSTNSFTIIVIVPGTNQYLKIPGISLVGTTLTIPESGYRQIEEVVEKKGDYGSMTPKMLPTSVVDPMGEYIEFLEVVACTNGAWNFQEETNILTWNEFSVPEMSDNAANFEIINADMDNEIIYRKNAYQLLYKIRLRVEQAGFHSCAGYLAGNAEDTPYGTNGTTTLYYADTSADFVVPQVRGLLYDVEFKKVDAIGNPLSGAEFTISGMTGAGQDICMILGDHTQAVSDENGVVKFENMPWGTYTITETKAPEGYIGAQAFRVILCYTTHPELLGQDQNMAGNEANMVYLKNTLPNGGQIVNVRKPSWRIVKASSRDTGLLLEGAEFTLVNIQTLKTYYGKSDELGIVEWYLDPAYQEMIKLLEIEAGTYTLKEIKAPQGYYGSSEEWILTFAESGSVPDVTKEEGNVAFDTGEVEGGKLYIFTYENTPVFALPNTGGTGIFWCISGGIMLMIASVMIRNKKMRVYPERKGERV